MAHHSEPSLTDDEIIQLFSELEDDDSGVITYANVKTKLEAILPGSAPNTHRLTQRFSRPSPQAAVTDPKILCILSEYYPKHRQPLTQERFIHLVRSWEIPSRSVSTTLDGQKTTQSPVPLWRRMKAWLSLEARQIVFVAFVVALQIAFGVWGLVMFLNKKEARHALGAGVVVAKTFAGAIYPTIFFMMLSMSRWLATLSRKIPGLGRFVNWDLHRGFHIYMCCSCLLFATIHGIAHLSGDFVWASRADHQDAVAQLWGDKWYGTPYDRYVGILPGWSGIAALIIFWLIFGLSIPVVRKRCFEAFQLGHLLLFPFVGLLAAHGTMSLLQPPLLGYFLLIPTVLVLLERLHRLVRGFLHMPATIKSLDKDTVTITIQRRWDGPWRCSAGQYVLLQIPSISWWQWHPFTISSCNADIITVHIRNAGNWTNNLRRLPKDTSFCASVDGPFGAPAQQIYQFKRAIVVGSGIGVTPMSSIANDFANKINKNKDPWRKLSRHRAHDNCSPFPRTCSPFGNRSIKSYDSSSSLISMSKLEKGNESSESLDLEQGSWPLKEEENLTTCIREAFSTPSRRRVDFHWITRDPPSLQWFSDYLNRAQEAAKTHSRNTSAVSSGASSVVDLPMMDRPTASPTPSSSLSSTKLEFNINTYVTAPNKTMSDHVFKHLIDRYRGPAQEYSILTSLKNPSHFRRPDFSATLRDYHQEMRDQEWTGGQVGVFYCGNPGLGATLQEACRTQTSRARADGSKITYRFITEVF